jgi:hypothetical protein
MNNMSVLKTCAAVVFGAALLAGCSTVENSHRQKRDMISAYERGNNAAVMEEINHKLREPAWYNSSVVNTGDEVMWRLEAGSMNFHTGNFKGCIDNIRIAEELILEYDDRATVSVRDVGAEAGTAVTNLNTLPYRGFCRDRIALSIYKSLAYLGVGQEEAFRAQVRRLRTAQKKVQEDYQKFFEQEKAQLDEQRRKNPKEAKKTDEVTSDASLTGNSQNAEFSAGLKDVRRIANRGYGNFLNPAAIFLSGLGNLRDGQPDSARIDFKRLYEAMPDNPMLQKYYVTVLMAAGQSVPAALQNVQPFDFPLDRDCVYVLFANGQSAAFRQIALYFPIMTAWPMLEFYAAPFKTLQVEADGKKYDTVLLADMDGVIAQEFNERLPGMIARIVISTLIKEAAYHASMIAIQNSNMDGTAKAIALTSVAVGGTAYRVAMNTADTRSWETLPKEFQLTQLPMPQKRELALTLGGGRSCKVQLPDNCRSAIVWVGAPSANNIKCHVLPLQSK